MAELLVPGLALTLIALSIWVAGYAIRYVLQEMKVHGSDESHT